MAITGAIFKTLTFNGESSKNYGIYITGQGVFNAPTRDVEMITIPGRNGSFPLDHGRFENIEVTYPAGIYADNESDFADAISDFRNMLCSAEGYCRLEDDYNPDEYRMAIYKSGLEVEPALLKAGEFEITFECKPQRYLKSGETEVSINTSDTTLTNPTRMTALPEFRIKGYGDVTINGKTAISITNSTFGNVNILNDVQFNPPTKLTLNADTYFENGDTFTVKLSYIYSSVELLIPSAGVIDVEPITTPSTGTASGYAYNGEYYIVRLDNPEWTFTKGTSSTENVNVTFRVTYYNGSVNTTDIPIRFRVIYAPSDDTLRVSVESTSSLSWADKTSVMVKSVKGISTKSVLGDPLIIDCELGEAYKIELGKVVPLNKYVYFGVDIPDLPTGNTIMKRASTMTELKVIPRWWKI